MESFVRFLRCNFDYVKSEKRAASPPTLRMKLKTMKEPKIVINFPHDVETKLHRTKKYTKVTRN